MKICSACEEQTLRRESVGNVIFNYRGVNYDVGNKTVLICKACGEKITTVAEMRRIEEVARAKHLERLNSILEEKSDERMYIRLPGSLKEEIAREAKLHHRKPQQWVKWALVQQLQNN